MHRQNFEPQLHIRKDLGNGGQINVRGETPRSAIELLIAAIALCEGYDLLIEAELLDCIVNLPAKLFLNTQKPACLWFLSRKKEGRLDKVLFVDARNLGFLVNRRSKDFTDEDIGGITGTYHHWTNKTDGYSDIPGFCKSIALDEIRAKDYLFHRGVI